MSHLIDWREDVLDKPRPTFMGRICGSIRIAAMLGVVLTGFVCFLVLRLIERPIHGITRPWTPAITKIVCRLSAALLGIKIIRTGRPMRGRGAMVANHGSWLDIFTLNACARLYFVSKADVARWPGIGMLARATGTLFIERKGTEAKNQQNLLQHRLRIGHKLMFFPEGTSTDTRRILPFKSTLFAAFYGDGLEDVVKVQPVTVVYTAPPGTDSRFYGWWGGASFGAHLWQVASGPKGGSCHITFHEAVAVNEIGNRKQLAAYCEEKIRSAHPLLEQD